MATVTAYIRTSAKKRERVFVRFRLSDGKTQLYHKSKIEIDPNIWDSKKQEIKARVVYDETKRTKFNNAVADRKKLIRFIYDNSTNLNSKALNLAIDEVLHPENYQQKNEVKSYFEIFDQFITEHKVSDGRRAHIKVLKRALQRYELYRKMELSFDVVTKDLLRDVESFLKEEPEIYKRLPEIYEQIPESRKPRPRGLNYIVNLMKIYRTFCLWAVREKKTNNNPFAGYVIDAEVYGSPIYISIEERNNLYKYDFSERLGLAVQRDIFVFQCVVGCRVGDLMKLTKSSVIDGAIEYVASKTKEERPITVRVPLNSIAKEILNRYQKIEGDLLLPFISEQNYNLAIKEMFKISGLTRMVTVLNTVTREEEQKPLNEIASSHLARRCFIGNLYKQVKDPNLVGSLSGHKEGSRAFARYREIDEDMKQDLVKLLE